MGVAVSWVEWLGRGHVDIVGAAEGEIHLSCIGDVRPLAFPSELMLSLWLSWGLEALSAAAVLSIRPSGRRQSTSCVVSWLCLGRGLACW